VTTIVQPQQQKPVQVQTPQKPAQNPVQQQQKPVVTPVTPILTAAAKKEDIMNTSQNSNGSDDDLLKLKRINFKKKISGLCFYLF
jgi:hypothetical protein